MQDELKARLLELGLTEDQISKLVAEGVVANADMVLLSADDIRNLTGCGLVTARKTAASFVPALAATVPTAAPVTGEEVVPEGAKPSTGQVNDFAQRMGIDPSMFSMFMFASMGAGAGMELDLSSFLPIPQIVMGYNPKIRDMSYMVMGQIEGRLNTPIVVINEDGSVNVELTTKYIMSLEEGFDPAEDNVYYNDAGAPFEVIRVGVDAQSIYDADPLDPTRALQKNGMGLGRVNWNGVSLEVRQVVFYASTRTHEVDAAKDSQLSWLREHIRPGVGRMALRGEYPKAMTEYNEAARTGSLPTLRVQLSRTPRRREVMPRRRSANPKDMAGYQREPAFVRGDQLS